MTATLDIFDALRAFFDVISDIAHALHMTPFTLLVILIIAVTGWHHWAVRYNARRDMEKAMRKAQQPPPLRVPGCPPSPPPLPPKRPQ